MPELCFCRQPGQGVLRVSGRDARKFLHAQTSQRIDDLGTGETRLAAWLSAKGRVLALFDVVPDGESFLLLMPADTVAAVSTGLRRYVLRDDVQIQAESDRSVLTVIGEVDSWLGEQGTTLPRNSVVALSDAILARTGTLRVDVIAPGTALPSILAGVAETDTAAGALVGIMEGRPEVPAALADRFTPHMLGLEREAVSFNKGCYPGQEIVARTEHRGESKRRIRRFACEGRTRPSAGDAIFDAAGATTGEVNRAAAIVGIGGRAVSARVGFELLAVVATDAAGDGLRLADGRALEPLPI
jgi:folate-binding protein YgfZ